MNNRKEAEKTGSHRSHQDANPCPICLAPLVEESYLDACFHKFCYNCIVRWSRVVTGKSSGQSASVKCPLCKEEDVDIVVHHIHGVIESFWRRIEETRALKKNAEARQDDFRIAVSDAAKPFLLARTHRFVTELELFLASGLNIEAYDAVYMQRLGWNTSGSSSSSISSGGTTCSNPLQQVVPYLYIFEVDSDKDE